MAHAIVAVQDRRGGLGFARTDQLQRRLDVPTSAHRRSRERVPAQPALYVAQELSPGELKVLRYLPMNLSRPEIAAELSVSVNTVSTHIRSIYAKLQVGDRSSAVQRARQLRLLAAAR